MYYIPTTRLFKKESTSEYWKVRTDLYCVFTIEEGIIGEEKTANQETDCFDSISSVEILIKAKLEDGFIEEVDLKQVALLERVEKADVRDDWCWNEVEKDFYDGLKNELTSLAEQGFKYSNIRFWFDVVNTSFFIYTDDDQIAEIDIPILWGIYIKHDLGEELPISFDELGERLYKHCSHVIEKLHSEKYFDGITNKTLSVKFETADDNFGEVVEVNL